MQNASVLVHSMTVLKPPQNTMPSANASPSPLNASAHARRGKVLIHLRFMMHARSVQALDALEGVLDQRLGVALGHMALLAEIARRADRRQLAALRVAEVGDGDLGRVGSLLARPRVAVQARPEARHQAR